jgi:hypothetical protein
MWSEPVFDITKLHRIVPVIVIIVNGLTVGVFAGFAGLALAMRRERQFCIDSLECDSRSYNLVFNCAWIGQALLGPFNGYVLDRAGPRVLTLIGALLAMGGLLFIAVSDTSPGVNGAYAGFDGWAGGFFLLGAAAPALQSPLFQLANLFVNRSTITSSVVSMFILSTAILPIVNEIHHAAGGQVSLRTLLLGLLVQPALCCCTSLLLIPRKSIPAGFLAEKERAIEEARLPAPVVVSEKLLKQTPSGRRLLRRRVRRFRLRRALDAAPRLQRSKQSKVFPLARLVALGNAKHGFWRQALSLEAIVAFFYFGFGLVHFNWYVATSRDQLVALGDDGLLSRAFPFILPAGVLATPFIGLLLDRGGIVATIWVSSLNVVLIAVLTLIPSLQAQWLTFLLLSIGRPLHMSLYFSCFGLFGLQHFGKLTSSIGFVIFGATNQLQFALLELVQVDASGRKDFTHANVVLLALAVGLGVAMSVMGCVRLNLK